MRDFINTHGLNVFLILIGIVVVIYIPAHPHQTIGILFIVLGTGASIVMALVDIYVWLKNRSRND